MSSLARNGGFFRAAPVTTESFEEAEEVFVIGHGARSQFNAPGTVATLPALIEAAEQRAAEILQEAEALAAATLRVAQAEAESIRSAAYRDGYEAGVRQGVDSGEAEIAALVDLARTACADGVSIRDQVAATSMPLLAEAVAIATRRLVGEWYDQDPQRTAAICADALRAASGQEVLSLRVHSSLSNFVQAALGTAGTYVQPDDAVAIGGCLVDLASGTIDASLDTRLSLLELGLQHAAGGAE